MVFSLHIIRPSWRVHTLVVTIPTAAREVGLLLSSLLHLCIEQAGASRWGLWAGGCSTMCIWMRTLLQGLRRRATTWPRFHAVAFAKMASSCLQVIKSCTRGHFSPLCCRWQHVQEALPLFSTLLQVTTWTWSTGIRRRPASGGE
jgi:hypothetical protein